VCGTRAVQSETHFASAFFGRNGLLAGPGLELARVLRRDVAAVPFEELHRHLGRVGLDRDEPFCDARARSCAIPHGLVPLRRLDEVGHTEGVALLETDEPASGMEQVERHGKERVELFRRRRRVDVGVGGDPQLRADAPQRQRAWPRRARRRAHDDDSARATVGSRRGHEEQARRCDRQLRFDERRQPDARVVAGQEPSVGRLARIDPPQPQHYGRHANSRARWWMRSYVSS
jgi:hypothetical protein